jgi:hypothetical protein
MKPREREHRFRRLKEMGCICCWMHGDMNVHPEIHHLNLGGHAGQKRRGDECTIPLCRWHHQGQPPEMHGPSLKRSPRVFRETYGTDDELLAKVDDLIRMIDDLSTGAGDPVADEIELLQRITERLNSMKWVPLTEALRNDSNT